MWLEDEQLGARFLIHDRDTKFSKAFRLLFRNAGIRPLKTPLLAPDANSFCEAWVGALKGETLDYFKCFNLRHLDYIAQQFVAFFNECRPHQGLGNRTLSAAAAGRPEDVVIDHAPQLRGVRCRRFLGGLLRHSYREAA